jgi:hypothetical protein
LGLVKTTILKFILFIVAIQILNLSVYANELDHYTYNHNYEDLGGNRIDSAIEYISEIIFDYHNAFPEYSNHRTNSHSLQLKHFSFKLIHSSTVVELPYSTTSPVYASLLKEDYQYLFFKEINPPPPKMC